MIGKSGTQKPEGQAVVETPALRVRVDLDLSEDTLREINRRVMDRGWGQSAVHSWFRWLSDELVCVLQEKKKAERTDAVLPFGEVTLELLAPPRELVPQITAELRNCMKGCDAGAELVGAVIAALEAAPRA